MVPVCSGFSGFGGESEEEPRLHAIVAVGMIRAIRGPVSISEPNAHVATRCAHGIVLLPTLLYRHQSSKPSLNTAASSNTKSTPEMVPVPVMTMGVAVAVLIGLGEPQGRPK